MLPVELPAAPPGIGGGNDPDLTTDSFRPKLTSEGRTHPVTSLVLDPRDNELRWAKLPPLEGVNRVPRVRPGAATLLTHPTLRTDGGKPAPVLVVGDAGKGRSMALLTRQRLALGPYAGASRRKKVTAGSSRASSIIKTLCTRSMRASPVIAGLCLRSNPSG